MPRKFQIQFTKNRALCRLHAKCPIPGFDAAIDVNWAMKGMPEEVGTELERIYNAALKQHDGKEATFESHIDLLASLRGVLDKLEELVVSARPDNAA